MLRWLWVTRLLLLVYLARKSLSIHFLPEGEGRDVSRLEAEDFFSNLYEKIAKRDLEAEALNPSNFTITKRDDIFVGLGRGFGIHPVNKNHRRSSRCMTQTQTGWEIDTNDRSCRWSVNSVLQRKRFPTLQTLSANILNGEDYVVTARVGDKLMAKHRITSKTPSLLPSMVLVHTDPVTLEIDLNPVLPKPKTKTGRKRREASASNKRRRQKGKRNQNGGQNGKQARAQKRNNDQGRWQWRNGGWTWVAWRSVAEREDERRAKGWEYIDPVTNNLIRIPPLSAAELRQWREEQKRQSNQHYRRRDDQMNQNLVGQNSVQAKEQARGRWGQQNHQTVQQQSTEDRNRQEQQTNFRSPIDDTPRVSAKTVTVNIAPKSQAKKAGSSFRSSSSPQYSPGVSDGGSRSRQSSSSQASTISSSTPLPEPKRAYAQTEVKMDLSPPIQSSSGISDLTNGMGSRGVGGSKKGPSEKTVKDVAITITAKGYMNIGSGKDGFGPKQTVTITKKVNEESYGVDWGLATDITTLANKLSGFLTAIENWKEYIPAEVVDLATKLNGYLGKVTDEAANWVITGAFDKEKNYQFSISRTGTTVTIGEEEYLISALTFVLSLEAEEDTSLRNAGYTFFANFDNKDNASDIFKMLGSAFNSSEILSTVLSSISSDKWCVMFASKNTTYINVVKKDVMNNCLGNGTVSALKDTENVTQQYTLGNRKTPLKFEETGVIQGIHFYVKAEFKELLTKCWENAEKGAKPANLYANNTNFAMYASITRQGLTFRLPGGTEDITAFAKSCMIGLLVGAPSYLTESQIKIDQLEYQRDPPVFKIGVVVEPSEENRFIPGTKIGLKSLKVVLNRKKSGGTVTWDVTGETEILVNDASLVISVKKVGGNYTIGVAIETFRLSDAAEGFSASNYPDILKTLGVKDFNLEYMYMGKGSFTLSIKGRPLIVNYDDLHVSVMVDAKTATDKKYSVGLYMNGANFDDLMKRIAGNEAMSLKWLSSLKAVVVFSYNRAGTLQTATAKKRSTLALPDNSPSAENEEASLVSREKRYARGGGGGRGGGRLNPPSSSSPGANKRPQSVSSGGRSSGRSSSSSSSSSKTAKKKTAGPVIEFPDLAEPFQDMKFTGTGLTFGVSWEIPNNEAVCEDNGVCIWLVENIGKKPKKTEEDAKNSHLMISGMVTSSWFTLKASLKNPRISLIDKPQQKLQLTEIALIIEVGVATPKFMIEATMTYEDAKIGATGGNILTFKGTIEATPISIQMTFSMEGYVFPSTYLAIGNVKLGIGYSFVTGLPTMMFGAAIMFGKLKQPPANSLKTAEEYNDKAIIVKGYFGINPGNPMKNFIYGSINKLTIRAVCEAFELKCNSAPSKLIETGFPSGITASYAGEKTTIPGVGDVEQGIYIKGVLNFLGLEAYCELGRTDQTWNILIEMSPINWADGWIQVLRGSSPSDADFGPRVQAKFGGGESELRIEGYVNALNYIKASVNITITKTKLSFVITAFVVPNLIEASIEFMINYDVQNAAGEDRFKFMATVSTNGMIAKLKEALKGFIDAMHDRAVAVIAEAERIVEFARQKVADARRKVEEWRKSIDDWKADLRAKKRALQEEANRQPPCDCPLVCMPFLDWDRKCWKVWGYWVGCPFLNDCFTKIKDPFCLANCALNKIVSALTRWAKQAVLSITMLIADGAKGLLGLADGVLDVANRVVDTAEKAAQWVRDGVGKLAEWAKGKVDDLFNAFTLHYLKLSARLTADYSPCVGFNISMTIKSEPFNRKGEVCLDVKSFIKAFMRLILDDTSDDTKELTKESEKLDEAEKKNQATAASEHELEEEERKTQSKIDQEKAKDFSRESAGTGKRSDIARLHKWKPFLETIPKVPTVRTAEEMEMIKLAKTPVEKYYHEDDEDPHMRSIIQNGPWAALNQKQSVGADATVLHDATMKEKRSLDFDEKLTPCERMKRALTGYSDLTDGMITYAKRIQDTNTGLEDAGNVRSENLRHLRSRIQDAEAKHNMSFVDREEAYFMYKKLSKGHEDMTRRSHIVMSREDSYALPVIRRQINSLLKKANGKNFLEFTELMHANAVQGYKRSDIPHPTDADGEKMLAKIKQDIQSIVTDEDSNIVPMSSRLREVKKSIIAMGTYTKQCNRA